MPAPMVKAIKRNINDKLAALTNPPMSTPLFMRAALAILQEYGIENDDLLHLYTYTSDDKPGYTRNRFPEWDCVLVLGWCYGKIEVAYFS